MQLDYWLHNDDWVEEIKEKTIIRRVDTGIATMLPPTMFGALTEEVVEIADGLPLHQVRSVYLPTGNEIRPHEHTSMRIYLYMLHDSPAYLEMGGPFMRIPTEAGELTEVARGRSHWVTHNQGPPRVTLAFMFTEFG